MVTPDIPLYHIKHNNYTDRYFTSYTSEPYILNLVGRMMIFIPIARVPRDTQIRKVIQHLRGQNEINVNNLHITQPVAILSSNKDGNSLNLKVQAQPCKG